MQEIKLTGGARIGMANATWPFATLKVNKNQLELNATVIGNLVFQPSDIISIEPYTQIPFLGQGIKINHSVQTYNQKVIFWTFQNPHSVLEQIRQTGFLAHSNQEQVHSKKEILQRQQSGGNPIKKPVIIGAIILWNLLFLMDFIPFLQGKIEGPPLDKGAMTALGLLFLSALLSLVSSDFRRLILKEGRKLEDIKKFSIFLMILSGFMLFSFILVMKALN